MLAWAHGGPDYLVGFTVWKAYEVAGPLVGPLERVATVGSVVVLAVLVVLWVTAWLRMRERGPAGEAMVWLVLASVSGFVVTNKVLSPQYLLWLLPAAAAGLLVLTEREAYRRLAVWTVLLLAATLLTHEVFPRHYGALIGHEADTRRIVELLAARNLLLLALFLYAVGRAARLVLRPRPVSPSTEEPRSELVDD
jgi:hypothetical protein